MKIFEYKAGSYIDPISKTVGTPTNVTHRQTEKGIAGYFNETSYIDLTNSVTLGTNDFSLVFNCKPTDFKNSLNVLIRSSTNGLDAFFNSFGNFIISKNGVANIFVSSMTFSKNKFYQIKYIRKNGVSYFYVNNVLISSQTDATDYSTAFTQIGRNTNGFIGYLQSIKIYDHVLSEQERNTLYEQFLQASPTEKPIRGFEYPKPTDLSYLKDTGLVAAYNMIPNGNTLVDISGNGNNGTIYGVVSTKDGMKSSKIGDRVEFSPAIFSDATVWSCLLRFKDYKSVTNFEFVLGASSTKNIFFRGGSGYEFIGYRSDDNAFHNSTIPYTEVENNENTLVISSNGTNISFYLNGFHRGIVTPVNTKLVLNKLFAGYQTSIYYSTLLTLMDARFYNYAFTPEQAKAYHNSFVKTYINETMENHPVGDTNPKGWIAGTGDYLIEEIDYEI